MLRRFASPIRRIATLTVALAAFLSFAAPAEAVTADERAVAWRINNEHYQRRLRSLAVWESLSSTARNHSCAMARSDRLSHNTSLTKQVPRGWRILGENVGMGWDLYRIHQAWMSSPGHRSNILDGRYRALGVGVCRDAGGTYWTTTIFYG